MKFLTYYLINVKNKKIGKISNYIISIFKINKFKKKKIIIINEEFLKIEKKYKKKYIFKRSKYLGGSKKIKFSEIYKKKLKEFIKNSIIKMLKNNRQKKLIKKNIIFLKNKINLNKIKTKILNF